VCGYQDVKRILMIADRTFQTKKNGLKRLKARGIKRKRKTVSFCKKPKIKR